MDPLIQGSTFEQMDGMEDFCQRSSDYWTAVAEATAFRNWPDPTGREVEYRGTPRQFEDIERRGCEEGEMSILSLVNPSPELQRSSRYTSNSHLPHRTVEHSRQQETEVPKVWQGAVKPGSNQRTRERQERRNQSAKNARPEAFAQSGSSRKALGSTEGCRRARGRSAAQKMVIHSQTGNWPQTIDWRTKRRENLRVIAHGSETKRWLSSHQENQAAHGLLHSPRHHPAEAALLLAVGGSSQPKETNDRAAHSKNQDIIIKTFGQTFVDDIKAICRETEARGGEESPSYACEFDTVNIEKGGGKADNDGPSNDAGKSTDMDASKVAEFDTTNLAHEPLKNRKRKNSLATEFMDLNYGIIKPIRLKSKIKDSLLPTNKARVPALYVGNLPFPIAPKDMQSLFQDYNM